MDQHAVIDDTTGQRRYLHVCMCLVVVFEDKSQELKMKKLAIWCWIIMGVYLLISSAPGTCKCFLLYSLMLTGIFAVVFCFQPSVIGDDRVDAKFLHLFFLAKSIALLM